MEASKYKRRAIQTTRQTKKIDLGITQPVPEASSLRPEIPMDEAVEASRGMLKIDPTTASRLRTYPTSDDLPVAPQQRTPSPIQARRQPAPTMSEFVTPPSHRAPQNPADSQPPKQSIAHAVTAMAIEQPESLPVTPEPIQQPAVVAAPQQTAPKQRIPGIDMELPGDESPDRNTEGLLKRSRRSKFKRWGLRGSAAAVALVLIGGGILFSQGYFKLNKIFDGSAGTAEALKPKVDPNLLKGEGSGRINVLLLGRGGGSHDAPDLTDTMMLASIDPVNNKTTLVSVPRDLWVNIPSAGNMKLNAAFETGMFKHLGKKANGSTDKAAINAGFKMANQAVEDVLGVNIDYNVMVDFKAFTQAVDSVNGVSVNVPADLIDPTMAWENGNSPIIAKAGPQVFNSKQALNYVRSRTTTSDFDRSVRQRIVLAGLKSKIDTTGTLSNPAKISGLMKAFGNNVQTDLSLNNAVRLYGILKKVSDANTNSIGLADPPNQFLTTGNAVGQSIVLPKAGLFKYSEIQAFMRSQLKDPYILKEKAKVVVLNGTTVPGVATAKADELRAYGYNVIRAGETPSGGWTQTMLVNLNKNKNKYTNRYLEQRMGVTSINSMPDETIKANGADFVIIVGSDKATPQ